MKTLALGVAAIIGAVALLPSTPAWTQDQLTGEAAIEKRQDLMKSAGRATKAAGQMVKGETDWDAAKASEAMQTLAEVGTTFPTLFPDDSKTGHDTEAAPAIWEKMDDFKALAASFAADAEAASAAAAEGLDAFKPAFGKVAGNCRDCHQQFRTD
ncbi:c-type cytochrome [Amorphus coralli]|uniref:c-type cytochrome n=1 Tax=Amorphus coralli TaxID=340680 RepID=UPI00036A55EB|nr:cytochrome c [Amorphus coralli]